MIVFIITEGTAKTGYGHLTRCLAIYQGFLERSIVPTIVAFCDANGKKVLGNVSLEMFDWLNDSDRLVSLVNGADIAIIDSYLAKKNLYEKIFKFTQKTVYLDDTLRLDYPPGIIINGAVHAELLPYANDDKNLYLLGLKYTPLRKAFWSIPKKTVRNRSRNILILMGGNDIRNITFKVLDLAIENLPDFNFHVVLGYKSNSQGENDYQAHENITFYTAADEMTLRDLMLRCDMAITAAGQTMYELEKCKTKCVAVKIAANQKHNVDGWVKRGYITGFLECDEALSPGKLKESLLLASMNQYKWSNEGNGAQNIVREILKTLVKLHQARAEDVDLLFRWTNNVEMRKNSINSDAIEYDTHVKWFKDRLKSINSHIFVVRISDLDVGQIRFDIENATATIDYFIDRDYRGLGLGNHIVHSGIQKLIAEHQVSKILAIVRISNVPSRKIFRSLGFTEKMGNEFAFYEFFLSE